MLLTRDQALKVSKRTFATVFLPELEGEVRLCSVSAATMLGIQEINARREKGDMASSAAVLLLEKCLVDEKDEQFFDKASAAAFYAKISSETLDTILSAIPGFIDKKKAAEAPPAVPSEAAPVAG